MNKARPVEQRIEEIGGRSRLLLVAVLVIWVLFLYYKTGASMVEIWWRSGTFNHAFLVPPIALWLIWRQRRLLAGIPIRPSPSAMPLLMLAGFAWLLGQLAEMNSVTQFALVAILVLLVPVLLGWQWARAIMFPLGFLFFAVPFGEFIMPPFMDLTANFTVMGLRWSGVPVYREGLHFTIPSGSWSVVSACSGVRYLIASLVAGSLFAYLNYSSLKKRLAFVAVSIVVPLVANWIRAYLIVMIAYLSSNKLATGIDHLIYGWVFFGFVITLTFMIGMRWSDPVIAEEKVAGSAMTGSAATGMSGGDYALFLAVAVISAAPVFWFDRIASKRADVPIEVPEIHVGGWQADPNPLSTWRPTYLNASASRQLGYSRGDHRVGLFVEYYRNQNFERKVVSSENVLVLNKDREWIQVGHGSKEIKLGENTFIANSGQIRSTGGQRLTAITWYWINGHVTTSPAMVKWYIAMAKLLGEGDDSAALVLYAPKEQEEGINDFIGAAWPAILDMLRAISGNR